MAHYDCRHCGASCLVDCGCTTVPVLPYHKGEKILPVPPIGLRPKEIVRVLRMKEIHEAFGRYLEKGEKIPKEWLDEFCELNSEG